MNLVPTFHFFMGGSEPRIRDPAKLLAALRLSMILKLSCHNGGKAPQPPQSCEYRTSPPTFEGFPSMLVGIAPKAADLSLFLE